MNVGYVVVGLMILASLGTLVVLGFSIFMFVETRRKAEDIRNKFYEDFISRHGRNE